MQLSDWLRKERRKRDMTQRDVARELDVSLNSVIAWERREHGTVPGTYQLRALSKLFEASADKLLKMLPPERVAERT